MRGTNESETGASPSSALHGEKSSTRVPGKGNKPIPGPLSQDLPLAHFGFEELGLVAFDPDKLTWWSNQETD